jgi:rubrerythrin
MMDTQFNIFEILQIAEEVERKAARFYVRAAEQCGDEVLRSVCFTLAGWRARHQEAWARTRRAFSERTGEFGRFDPDDYVGSNPQVMAGLSCFASDSMCCHSLARHVSHDDILQDAIQRAMHVIIFYRGLKDFTRTPDCRIVIDNMIGEEQRHIRLLAQSLHSSAESRARKVMCVAS